MALQNRVTPFGQIVAAPERGTMMGNRGGNIHTDEKRLRRGRPWTNERWITCVLEFKDRHREVMQPGKYTELFFLDEATAFAAGHRPCAECRRADFTRFNACWVKANRPDGFVLRTVSEIDRQLHEERIVAGTRNQRTWRADAATLPGGTFVEWDGDAFLVWDRALRRWSFGGYNDFRRLPAGEVTVLTPPSIVQAFAAGYVPKVHGM
jgi:hypothetical protein